MARKTYEIIANNEVRGKFTVDLTQADSPVCVVNYWGKEEATGFQSADAGHYMRRAAALVIRACASVGEGIVGEDEMWNVREAEQEG